MRLFFRSTFLWLLLLLTTSSIAGCVSTRLQTSWRDPGFYKTFKKVFIICKTNDDLVRSTLESDLADQLNSRGIQAVPSTTVYATLRDVDRETIKRKIREIDADGVLFVRPVRHEKDRMSFDDAMSNEMGTLTLEVFRVQASLYEASKGQVIWEALSDTMLGGSWIETLKEYARIIGRNMIEQGVI